MRQGRVAETQYALVSPDEVASSAPDDQELDPAGRENGYSGGGYPPPRSPNDLFGGLFGNSQGGGLFGNLFGQPQRPPANVPPSGAGQQYPGSGQYGDLRPRNNDDRRWFPPRQVDPDVPWRDRPGDF
jgi:hypothetical protein